MINDARSSFLRNEFDKTVDNKTFLLWKTEPVGSVAPRLPPKSKYDTLVVKRTTRLAIVCDAQSHPAPAFRYFSLLFPLIEK